MFISIERFLGEMRRGRRPLKQPEELNRTLEEILETDQSVRSRAALYRVLQEKDCFKGVYLTFLRYVEALPEEVRTKINTQFPKNGLSRSKEERKAVGRSKKEWDALRIYIQELLDSGKYFTRKEVYQVLKDEGKAACVEISFIQYFRKQHFTLPKNFRICSKHKSHKKRSERLKELSDLIESLGTNDAQVLAENMRLTVGRVASIAQKEKISLTNTFGLERLRVFRRNPIRDEVIAHNPPYLTLDALAQAEAEKTGQEKPITRERMRQYLIGTGQYNAWQQRRDAYEIKLKDEKIELNNAQQQLVDLMLAYLWKKAVDEGPAMEKAVMYHLKNRNRGNKEYEAINLKRLIGLFTDYYTAKEQGKQLSLEELGKPYSIFFTNVRYILKAVGEESMYGVLDRHITPAWKKQALQRGKDLAISASQIAYFLDISDHVAHQNLKRYGRKGIPVDKWLVQFGNRKNLETIQYKHASQLYEALDVGFSREEARIYAGRRDKPLSENALAYILDHRQEIEPVLVNAIRVLYNQLEYNKSYVTKELKEVFTSSSSL